MRNVWLALVAFIPLSAQACEGTYRGSVSQSFAGSSQEGDIELVVKAGEVSGFVMGHAQKVQRKVSGYVEPSCRLVNTVLEGVSGKFALDGTPEQGTGKSMGADAFRLKWSARKVD